MVRGNDTRWSSKYDEAIYHDLYFPFLDSFFKKVFLHAFIFLPLDAPQACEKSDNDSIWMLAKLLNDSKDVVRVQLGFVVHVMKPLYENIKVLQKQTGGPLDVIELFHRFAFLKGLSNCLSFFLHSIKAGFSGMELGNWPPYVSKLLNKMGASKAGNAHKTMVACLQVRVFSSVALRYSVAVAQAMVEKTNNLTTKTIKGDGVRTVQAIASLCPGTLQTEKMVTTTEIKKVLPLINAAEWEKYITLPPQKPPPSTTNGRIEWWKPSCCFTFFFRSLKEKKAGCPFFSSAKCFTQIKKLSHSQPALAKLEQQHGPRHVWTYSPSLLLSL